MEGLFEDFDDDDSDDDDDDNCNNYDDDDDDWWTSNDKPVKMIEGFFEDFDDDIEWSLRSDIHLKSDAGFFPVIYSSFRS